MKGVLKLALGLLLAAVGGRGPLSAKVYTLSAGGAELAVDVSRGARIISLRRGDREMLLPDSVNGRFYGATMWVSPQRDYWPERPALDREPYKAKYKKGTLHAVSATDSLTGLRFEKRFSADETLGGFDIEYTIHNDGKEPRRVAVWDVARVRHGLTYFPFESADIPGCESNLSDLTITPSLAVYAPSPGVVRGKEKFYAKTRKPWIAHRSGGLLFVKMFEPTAVKDLPPLQGEVEIFSAPGRSYVEIENHGPYTLLLPGESVSYRQRWYLHDDDSRLPVEERVEALLPRLTLDEKLALIRAESKFASGGVPRFGIPTIEMADGPHGIRAEFERQAFVYRGLTTDSATVFPSLTALAATWNPALAAEYGEALGEEAAARGKDVVLGPGLNISRSPLGGRNFEYMGEDPFLAGRMAVSYIRGIQSKGVAACAKHFAANNQETARTLVDARVSDNALRSIYLPAFKAAVEEGGVWSVMGAYNKVNGQYACHNFHLVNDILKGEWGFDGALISDWGGTHSTREAALNGLDIEMATYIDGEWTKGDQEYGEYYLARPYKELLISGEIPLATLDDKVRRVLRLRFRTEPYYRRGSIATPEHFDVARRIAEEGVVLLKNDTAAGQPLLPLAAGRRILVVGDNAVRRLNEGGGSSELKAARMVSPLEGMRQRFGDENVRFARGYVAPAATGLLPIAPPTALELRAGEGAVADSLRAEAVAMAREADVVVLFGGLNKNQYQDCESDDRLSFSLPFFQDELIDALLEANPNLVMVLLGGNPVELPAADRIPALLQAFYPGSMGGTALAGIISGDVNPSGRLPFTFPRSLSDLYDVSPFTSENPPTVEYAEDTLVGYRWFHAKGIAPLFPFGHGLSYTTFRYSNPRREGNAVMVDVTNTGDRAGAETMQLYSLDPDGVKSLAAFSKVSLAPGETRTVSLDVSAVPPGAGLLLGDSALNL